MKRLIAAYNGVTEYQHIDPMKPGDLIVEASQNCANIIEGVKEARNRPVGKEWRHVAEIPLIFYDKAVREGWVNDKARWHKWLNDPDNAAFRVWNGRIGKHRQI